MSEQQTYIAKTLFGFEQLLAQELRELGASDILEHNRAVNFTGNKELLYKANLWSRTAISLLKPIAEFTVTNEEQLYQAALKVDWPSYMNLEQTFAVYSSVNSEYFNHSLYVAQKTKDAIADQFRRRFGERPNVDRDLPNIVVQVHIYNDRCTFLLDSSGESLHRRGYKVKGYKAPLSEVLAAGMIQLSGWDKKTTFYDPMCGSGTLITEAAMLARNIAPGLYRDSFGFMHWPDYDAQLWNQLVKEARKAEIDNKVRIIGSDAAQAALNDAKENIESAELDDMVELQMVPFEYSEPPTETGHIVMNPPYGERIEKEDLVAFYKQIGDTFKQKYAGWTAWVLSSNLEVLKHLGLRPSRKVPLYNGPLECRFNKYEMYAGTKKIHKLQNKKG